MPTPLPRRFYARPTVEVARALLGQVIVHGPTAGRIVEVEAYLGGDDLASHSARGLTERTRVIFGPPGHAYVYLIYGMHECLNLVAERDGTPGCVLIRALEPVAGFDLMRERRGVDAPHQWCSGPGKLTQALAIDRTLNGVDVTGSEPLMVVKGSAVPAASIAIGPRIGISKCVEWPLRFWIGENRHVSKSR